MTTQQEREEISNITNIPGSNVLRGFFYIVQTMPSQSPAVTALPKGEPRGCLYCLPLPLGEVAERSEDGEGNVTFL